MQRILILILGLAMAAGATLADHHNGQDNPGKGPHGKGGAHMSPEQRRAHMQERLGLSDEQMSEMRAIRERGGNRDEMRSVLTDEQREKMDAHRARMQERSKARGYGYGRPPEESQDESDAR